MKFIAGFFLSMVSLVVVVIVFFPFFGALIAIYHANHSEPVEYDYAAHARQESAEPLKLSIEDYQHIFCKPTDKVCYEQMRRDYHKGE